MNNIGDFLVLGILFAFFWAVSVLIYLARIHYELNRGNKVVANLLRQLTGKNTPMNVKRAAPKPAPSTEPQASPEQWQGWYQDENGQWHQSEGS